MDIIHGRTPGASAEKRTDTFTGDVWGDPMLKTDDVVINTVYFGPGARSHWHSHERGQALYVTTGQGWVGLQGEPAEQIRAGDTIWTPPGQLHWHGAGSDSFMVHISMSHGPTEWQHPVTDQDYPPGSAANADQEGH